MSGGTRSDALASSERVLLAATWRKLLHGEIRFARHLETARDLAGRAVSVPTRARSRIVASRRGGEPAREPIEDLFDALKDRRQRGLLLFTGSEVLRTELSRSGVLDRIDRWPNLELTLAGTSADTHTLQPLWLQRQVHALVDRVLEEELARVAA